VTLSESHVVYPDRVITVRPVQTTSSDEWRAAVRLAGQLDISNAGAIHAVLTSHLDAGRRLIRVDVADVEFIDCTAINELLMASKRCRHEFGSLILTNVPRAVLRVVQLTGLGSALLIDNADPYEQSRPHTAS
jgi:anti-anti-sigma factor